MWGQSRFSSLPCPCRVPECSKAWCDLWDSILKSLHTLFHSNFLLLSRVWQSTKYIYIVTSVLNICMKPSGEEARNCMTFSTKAQHPSVPRQLFLSLGGNKIITVGRNSIYILMHCFVRNPCTMHQLRNKWAQIPHHCIHGILFEF